MSIYATHEQRTDEPQDNRLEAQSVTTTSVLGMTALMFFGVGVPCWLAFGLPAGIGLGAMCAVWGGPGFGVMAAGARLSARAEHQAVAAHSTETPRTTKVATVDRQPSPSPAAASTPRLKPGEHPIRSTAAAARVRP